MKKVLYSKIEGTGIPFLVIHGYLGMSDNWKSFGTHLATLGYEVHMLDMRNHGRSFHSEIFTYDAMVEDVIIYMQDKNIDEAIVLGHSMGGKIAMKLAVTYPEKVKKLIVADISPREYAPHHQDILAGLNAVDFSVKPSRNDVDKILSNYISDVSTRMFLMKNLYWKEPGQLAFRFNLDVFNKNEYAIGEGLEENDIYEGDTLFLRGENSNYIQEKDLRLIEVHFPKAIVISVSNSGHWLHAENPDDFFKYVKEFIG